MPRQERLHSATSIYHVMLRGINRQDIFEDDEDYLQMTSIKTKMITEPSLGHSVGQQLEQVTFSVCQSIQGDKSYLPVF